MKKKNIFKKLITLFTVFIFALCGCKEPENSSKPTNLTTSSSEVKMIINSVRDLNDIVTLRFEPNTTTERDVTWFAEENDVFTLDGSIITANNIGNAVVTATSVANPSLSTDITIKVYDPNLTAYTVSCASSSEYSVSGLENEYYEGEEVSFGVNVLTDTKEIESVKVNELVVEPSADYTYSFTMPGNDVNIVITLKNVTSIPDPAPSDKPSEEPNPNPSDGETPTPESSTKYNVKFDLGTYKTARRIEDVNILSSVFELENENINIISSITSFDYLYGGGNGGRSETAWYAGDMLKFGTTSVNGYITFALNAEVVGIKITGYVSDSASKIRVGDETSSDWADGTADNKTTLVTCTDMAETTKEVIENNQTTTIEVSFASTKNLKISTTNKKPLYITAIEFIVA